MNNQKYCKNLLVVSFAILCFAVVPIAQAVSPPPDGCYLGFTTAQGCDALHSLTTGFGNTGLGWRSLFSDTDGNFNTGVGVGTLVLNNGNSNTAVGAAALLVNTAGVNNTAVGADTLIYNDSGGGNTAIGFRALMNNTASLNTAVGRHAGDGITSGTNNVCLGANSGSGITTGSNIITIGPVSGVHSVFGQGDNRTFIANVLNAFVDSSTAQAVYVDADGRLGTVLASAGPEPSVPLPAIPKDLRKQSMSDDGQVILDRKLEALQVTVAELKVQLREQAQQIQNVSAQAQVNLIKSQRIASTSPNQVSP